MSLAKTHFEGYEQARQRVMTMCPDDMLDALDMLWGRGDLPSSPTTADIRKELLRQMEIDWRVDKKGGKT